LFSDPTISEETNLGGKKHGFDKHSPIIERISNNQGYISYIPGIVWNCEKPNDEEIL